MSTRSVSNRNDATTWKWEGGQPAFPLRKHGYYETLGWDIPTHYAVDAQRNVWMCSGHGATLHIATASSLIEDLMIEGHTTEALSVGEVLGLSTTSVICRHCNGTGKVQAVSGMLKK